MKHAYTMSALSLIAPEMRRRKADKFVEDFR